MHKLLHCHQHHRQQDDMHDPRPVVEKVTSQVRPGFFLALTHVRKMVKHIVTAGDGRAIVLQAQQVEVMRQDERREGPSAAASSACYLHTRSYALC